jgi:hypothetical protein
MKLEDESGITCHKDAVGNLGALFGCGGQLISPE